MRLILYGTGGCHLCEEAEIMLSEAIRAHGTEISVEIVDIADRRELEECYGVRIPVIRDAASDAELSWPFGEEQLRTLVQSLSRRHSTGQPIHRYS